MDEGITVRAGATIPAGDLRWRFSRSSGPGGQSVNTADSRVELTVDLVHCSGLPPYLRQRLLSRLTGHAGFVAGEFTVAASEHRSQLANREAARSRLRAVLAAAAAPPPPPRRPTRPGRAAVERRLAGKRTRGQVKQARAKPSAAEE